MAGLYDIVVAYRVSPVLSQSAGTWFHSKFDLFRACLKSFAQALNGLNAKIFAILDRCPSEYELWFKRVCSAYDLEIIKTRLGRNVDPWLAKANTFMKQLKTLISQHYSDIFFFAEDDYLYVDRIAKMVHFMSRTKDKADFVSPYEHPWFLHSAWKKMPHREVEVASHWWRTAPFETATFVTRRDVIRQAYPLLAKYPILGGMQMFLLLTKGVLISRPDLPYYRYRVHSLKFGLKEYLSTRKFYLWYPVPTIAAHVVRDLPPGFNWKGIFEGYLKDL